MARGFESKDVEFQQEEAARQRTLGRGLTTTEREVLARQRTTALALASARADLAKAVNPVHRHMLEQKIAALQQQRDASE